MLADAGILDALRGRATYLLLERQDRVGQAISRVIAWQNGRWTTAHASDVPDSALVFDCAAIGWIVTDELLEDEDDELPDEEDDELPDEEDDELPEEEDGLTLSVSAAELLP